MKTFQSYEILLNKHKDQTAYICGSGTSFYDIIKTEKLNKINDVIISVNASIIVLDWDKGDRDKRYWISNDSMVRLWDYWIKVKRSKAIKIIRNSWEKYYNEVPDDFLVFCPRKNDYQIDENEKALCYHSSVPSAIDLAIQMGCNKIYILGVDHYAKKTPLGMFSHFWQFFPKEQQPKLKGLNINIPYNSQQEVFKENIKVFEALEKFAQKKKVKIYNCNPKSEINTFEKVEFKKIV